MVHCSVCGRELENPVSVERGIGPVCWEHVKKSSEVSEGNYEEAGLRINPEYERLLPPLTAEEFEALKLSIKNEGLHFPIVVNGDRFILDGYHRARACLQLGIKPKTEVKKIEDPLLEKKFVIEANLRRRQLNDFQKAELAYVLEPIERELANQRMGEAGKLGRKIQLGVGSNEHTPDFEGKARDIAAAKVGLSPTTYHRAKTVLEKGSEALKEKVRKGKTSIAYAYQSIMREERHNNPPPLPDGRYDVILADPAWNYSYMAIDGNPELHYNTITLDDICSLNIPSAEDAILFLWATNPKLEECLQVMKAWGFEYKTNVAWVKNGLGKGQGIGHYIKGDHELLLIGKKGAIPVPIESSRPSSVLLASKTGHSKKPTEVYPIIERMYPNRSYLEVFARNSRPGWESWGNQLEK